MPLYENLDNLKEREFFEECKARVQPFKWLLLFLILIFLVLMPIGFGFLSLLVGMGGSGLAFELDEKLAKPDAYERLVAENKQLRKDLKELRTKRIRNVKEHFKKK